MTTMRAANEVRAPEFRDAGGDVEIHSMRGIGYILRMTQTR